MSPRIFDWYKLHAEVADETFGIPADVVFQIVENGELHEIKAHKWTGVDINFFSELKAGPPK